MKCHLRINANIFDEKSPLHSLTMKVSDLSILAVFGTLAT